MIQVQEATNVTDVRNHLLRVFNGLCNGSIEPKEATEINNTAGKIMASLKVQLTYHEMRVERPEIEFLNSDPTTKTIEQDKTKKIEKPKS